MKKQMWHKKLGRIIYSSRFYTGVLLLLMMIPGILFTKRVVRADEIDMVSDKEFQEILNNYRENQELLSEGEVLLTLNDCPLPYDRGENIWYVAQNPENRAWEGVLGLSERDAVLYLLD